jgi:hypothetical protein
MTATHCDPLRTAHVCVTRLFGTTAGPPDAIPKANCPASSPVDTLRSPEGASSSGPPEAFLRANSSLHRLDFPQNAHPMREHEQTSVVNTRLIYEEDMIVAGASR